MASQQRRPLVNPVHYMTHAQVTVQNEYKIDVFAREQAPVRKLYTIADIGYSISLEIH